MASIFEQYGIKEVADVTFYERDTAGHEKPVLYIDTAKVSTIEKTASTAEARGGKGNPALISWDFGLEINVTLEDALFSPQSMAIMQGSGKVESATTGTGQVYIDVTNEVYEYVEYLLFSKYVLINIFFLVFGVFLVDIYLIYVALYFFRL